MLKFIKDFNLHTRCLPTATTLAGCLFLFILPFRLYPQGLEPIPFIEKINLTIDEEPGGPEMIDIIPLKEGEPYSLKRITESIRQLYKTGLFSDVQVLREGEQRIRMTFLLTRKLFIRNIDFIGSSEIPYKKIKKGLYALREEGSYSAESLYRAVDEIRELLNEWGFFQANIEPIIKKDPSAPYVDVSFHIHSTRRYILSRIDFEGELIFPEEELREKMRTKEGNEFVPSDLQNDLDRLRLFYNSMDYRRAEVLVKEQNFDESQGRVGFVIQVIPQERIEIVVTGADVPLELLMPIWEAQIFEEWGLSEGEAKIIRHMRKKGYLFASVDSSIQNQDNLMRIDYKVTPGERYKIQGVTFEGLAYFTPAQIKEALLMKQRFSLFQKTDGARLFELPREIELLYKTHGFSEPQVELNLQREGQKIKPILSVREGRQQRIESVSVTGARLLSEEVILQQINCTPGGAFFQPDIQKDIEKMQRYYLNQGVRGTEIVAVIQPVQEDLFSVRFDIREGHKVRIENIIITGYKATKKNTISREILLREGNFARYDAIRETERRLERLGIFTDVNIEEIPVSPDKENLLVHVMEGARNYASLGLGMESKDQPRTFAVWNNEYRPRGTAEYIRYNVFGAASQVSLFGQLSLREKRGVFSWRQPYFFGLPMETYLNAWAEREARKSFTYDGRGISLTTVKTISRKENMDFLATLRFARTIIVELSIPESGIDRRFFPYSTTSISGSYIWERRDDLFNPSRGFFFSSALEWAYPYIKAESEFFKTFNKFQYFASVVPGLTFSSTVRVGLAKGKIPIHERFFAGGSNSFRGVEFDELGPKDPESGKPIGGKALILFNFEITFPILSAFKDLNGVMFYDKGNVFDRRIQVNLAGLQDAIGMGLRYRTPLGPVRLELAWNLDAPSGEKRVLGFITLGNVF
ncbi:MAG: BamA/TamA family outer membrane protein [Candidatus Aminicenantes bacterium]|nr:BamA/TamA family outer membrane protein [Candidatus Aminicenantes bacterium]MDH5383168.1 BamA/TamA family outer membrane protein [Candidatus Aminicenantes bacterium]MDH5743029.1 BamA/TamA family outer membrane protein [Candidatus Aminicenantes bacterium]